MHPVIFKLMTGIADVATRRIAFKMALPPAAMRRLYIANATSGDRPNFPSRSCFAPPRRRRPRTLCDYGATVAGFGFVHKRPLVGGGRRGTGRAKWERGSVELQVVRLLGALAGSGAVSAGKRGIRALGHLNTATKVLAVGLSAFVGGTTWKSSLRL